MAFFKNCFPSVLIPRKINYTRLNGFPNRLRQKCGYKTGSRYVCTYVALCLCSPALKLADLEVRLGHVRQKFGLASKRFLAAAKRTHDCAARTSSFR
jgi:hypothetical protein